jgi:hypothetical protein
MKFLFMVVAFFVLVGCSHFDSSRHVATENDLSSAQWKMKWVCFDKTGNETLRIDGAMIGNMGSEWVQVVMKDSYSRDAFSYRLMDKTPGLTVMKNDNELIVQFKRRTGDSDGCYIGSAYPTPDAFNIYGSFGCKGSERKNMINVFKVNGVEQEYLFGNNGGHCDGKAF